MTETPMQAVQRIDCIQGQKFLDLVKVIRSMEPPEFRKKVILAGLRYSKTNQFTWAYVAGLENIPKAEWPEQECL